MAKKTYKYVTVVPDQREQYYYLHEAITDNGFEQATSKRGNPVDVAFRGRKTPLYTKDNKYYVIVSFNHFNTQVYSFKMREIERGIYEEID